MPRNGNINEYNIQQYYDIFEYVCTTKWANKTEIKNSRCAYEYDGTFLIYICITINNNNVKSNSLMI